MKQFVDTPCKVTRPVIEGSVKKEVGELVEKSKPVDKRERLDQDKTKEITKTLLTS